MKVSVITLIVTVWMTTFNYGVVCRTESGCVQMSKFDYEFKMLQKMVQMDADKREIDTTIGNFETMLASFKTKMETFEKIVSDFTSRMELMASFQEKLTTVERAVEQLEAPEIGSTFTRWGRSICPETNTTLIYSGHVGGSHYTHSGAASNYLCLTKEPTWGEQQVEASWSTYLYGGEYDFGGHKTFGKGLDNLEPPCAVCRSPRSSVIMIPGRNVCLDGWVTEYSGYLVAGYHPHAAASEFICLDVTAVAASDSNSAVDNGKLMYTVRAVCGSLKCPPYKNDWTVTCVVCSK